MPVSWNLSGINEFGKTDILDQQDFEQFPDSGNFYAHFTIKKLVGAHKSLIFTQERNSHTEKNQLVLYGIEFYGLLHQIK